MASDHSQFLELIRILRQSLAAHGCGRIAMASASCLPSLHHHANPARRKVSARSIRPPMEPSGVPPWPTAGWRRYANAEMGAVTIFCRLLMAKRARGRFDILAFAPKSCCLASPNSVHHRQLRSSGAVDHNWDASIHAIHCALEPGWRS